MKHFTITACLICSTALAACGGGDSALDAQAESAPFFEQEMLQQRSVVKVLDDAVALASIDAGAQPAE